MSDFNALRELVGQVPPPKYDDLVAVARKRRRRSALSTTAAAAVVVLGVGIAGATLSGGERAHTPVEQPSPTETESPSADGEWTPEEVRAEGSPGDPQGAISTETGLATRLYEVCDGTRCDAVDGPPEHLHVALEVTQAGQSAVFDLHYSPQPWVKAFDEDSVLVQDGEYGQPDGLVRYRLLHADGTAVELQLLDNPAPAVPGAGVVLIDRYNSLLAGSEEVYLIDEGAGTLRPLDVPPDVRYWGPNVDEFLWGVTDDCRVFWASNGTFEERQLDCAESLDFTDMDGEFPDGWLRPGRMAVTEHFDPGNRMAVHVSLDYGVTWQRFTAADGETPDDILRQLG